MSLNSKPTILIIDDSPDVINLVSELLKNNYKVKAAISAERGLDIAQNSSAIDLILLDIMMPKFTGFEICKQLKDDINTRDIPIIFITAMCNLDDELKGLKLGAVDYIFKPISPAILIARVANYLKIKAADDFLKDKNKFIEAEIRNKSKQLAATHDLAILVLAELAKLSNNDTENSMPFNTLYVEALAEQLKNHPCLKHFLSEQSIKNSTDTQITPFDPDLMKAFLALTENFKKIADHNQDANDMALKTNTLN